MGHSISDGFQILSYLQVVSKDSLTGLDREISPLVDGITGLRALKGLAQGHAANNGDLRHLRFLSALPCVLNVSM